MLVVVAYELPQLLLSALQCRVKLLHLTGQVGLLHFQTLAVCFHRCDTQGSHTMWHEKSEELNSSDRTQRGGSWRGSGLPLGVTVLFFCSRGAAAEQLEGSDETR